MKLAILTMASTLLRSAVVIATGLFASLIYRGYQQRKLFRRTVREYGGPTLPGHSWIFGDLITVGKCMSKHTDSVHGQLVFHLLALDYPEIQAAGALYVDLWPISYPTLATFLPELTSQYTQDQSQPKHAILNVEFNTFTGMKDLVTSDGQAWKKWRMAFNPGFSSQNVMALVPLFVREALVWKEYLHQVAETGETIKLEKQLMKATCDVISYSVLGASAGIQTSNSRLWWALKAQISFLYADWGPQTLTKALHPLRPVLMWYYNRVLRQELLPLIKAQMKEEDNASEGFKTISRLALRAFKKEYGKATEDERRRLEAEFLDVTVEQMKIFFFAGHDTTSSTLCFAYAELCNHPEALRKVREEHDSVFGTDASKATQLLTEDPVLLNKLPYTAAIMKEVLRMYPPIGSVRAGSPTLHLADPKVPGRRLPTNGFMLHDCTLAIHRHPDLWFKPDEFIPERWLESEGGKIGKNTFRAFSLGPRNCIGQELAMTELKMLLVMTIRELDFELAYTKDDPRILGSQTFQAQMPGELVAHPSKGLPVRISLRQQATT